MTVWATAIFQRDEHPTDAYAGTFTTAPANGLFPTRQPLYAIYLTLTFGGGSGGTIAGQGGGISVF